MRDRNTALLLLALVAAPACDRTPTEPAGNYDTVMAMTSLALAMRPAVLDPNEPYVQACEAGGRFIVEGTTSHGSENDGSFVTWDQVMRHEDCALSLHEKTVVANGEMRLTGEAHFGAPVDGVAPLRAQQSEQHGSMTTQVAGEESRTCDYDLSTVFNASSNRYDITGMMCGRSVTLHAPAAP